MNANDLHTLSHSEPQPARPARSSAAHDLLVDSCRLGPAPTRSREGSVAVATVIVLALAIVLIQPPVALAAIVVAVAALHLAVRWVIGARRWNRR